MCVTQRFLCATIVSAALLFACGGNADDKGQSDTPSPTPLPTISGTMSITGAWKDELSSYVPWEGTVCRGTGGFDDIREGAQVVVRDETDSIIGTSRLGAGVAVNVRTYPDSFGIIYASADCQFPFEVTEVPTAKFYSIEVTHRGGVTFSPAELDAKGWKVAMEVRK